MSGEHRLLYMCLRSQEWGNGSSVSAALVSRIHWTTIVGGAEVVIPFYPSTARVEVHPRSLGPSFVRGAFLLLYVVGIFLPRRRGLVGRKERPLATSRLAHNDSTLLTYRNGTPFCLPFISIALTLSSKLEAVLHVHRVLVFDQEIP